MPLDLILKEENEQMAIDNAMQAAEKQPLHLSNSNSSIEGSQLNVNYSPTYFCVIFRYRKTFLWFFIDVSG